MVSPLPPVASEGVLTTAASAVIEAPIDKVWDILLDFKGYKEWNAFVRGQTIIDYKSGKPLESQNLTAAGQHMHIYPVHLPPTLGEPSLFQKQSTYVVCTGIDQENYRVSWATAGFPRFLLYAHRWQTLTDLGDGRVKYETIEVFNGLFAYFVKWFVGKNLVLGAKAMAEGLKQKAEAR